MKRKIKPSGPLCGELSHQLIHPSIFECEAELCGAEYLEQHLKD